MARAAIIAAVVGFLAAAAFYQGPVYGFDTQPWAPCPVCPHISAAGANPHTRYLPWVMITGIPNAALFAAVTAICVAVVRSRRRWKPAR